MKRTPAICVLLCFFALLANAQNPRTGLKAANLKGRVKQATMNIYPSNTEIVDTTHLPTKIIQTFNEDGNQILENMINDYGKPFGKKVYDYLPDRTIEIDVFGKKDSLLSQIMQKYNKKGLETEFIVTPVATGIVTKQVLVYDKKGRQIEADNYRQDKLGAKILMMYDENGQKIEDDIYDPQGNLRQRTNRPSTH